MDDEQARILSLLAELGDQFESVQAVYLFGSVARGSARPHSDVDVWFEFSPKLTDSELLMEDFGNFQAAIEAWRTTTSETLGRRIDMRNWWMNDPTIGPELKAAISVAASHPAASLRKAAMIIVPPWPFTV